MSFSLKNPRITNKEAFATHIRALAKFNKITLLEAIASYSEDNGSEIDELIGMIDANLREELRCECIDKSLVVGIDKPITLF